ncbi:MAG: chemotaxis protein CheX [Armatimonadota bacterium]
MRVEFVEPFVRAGISVMESVSVGRPERGQLSMRHLKFTTQQVTIVAGVTGDVRGQVLYGMSLVTAEKIATAMLQEPVMTFDELATSAIAELGNMITGNAIMYLSEKGFNCVITPPSVIRGMNVEISTPVPALVVPLITQFGKVEINIALAEVAKQDQAPTTGGDGQRGLSVAQQR